MSVKIIERRAVQPRTATNDNQTPLLARRRRESDRMAAEIGHRIERRRFLRAWISAGKPAAPTLYFH